jgi:hypothetical protein
MSALPPEADMLIVGIDVCKVPEADIPAAVSLCSVSAETCESNVRFGINSLVTSAVGRTVIWAPQKILIFRLLGTTSSL